MLSVETETKPHITVFIVSNRSLNCLIQAINSVVNQVFTGVIKIIVVRDVTSKHVNKDDYTEKITIEKNINSPANISFYYPETMFNKHDDYIVEKVSFLRNFCLSVCDTPLLCFLDDDNYWDKNHLYRLYKTLTKHKCQAAYSWRYAINQCGETIKLYDFPWAKTPKLKKSLWNLYSRLGVIKEGSAVIKDNANLWDQGRFIGMVDMGTWLFTSFVFEQVSFSSNFTISDYENVITEDDKLLFDLNRSNLCVKCTKSPTLFYRVGGYSNNFQI